MTAASTTRVAELERPAARTWRGLDEEPYGDWLLRAGVASPVARTRCW
ncbi:hypothetical protein [Blastococcus sp. SYSU DS0541]